MARGGPISRKRKTRNNKVKKEKNGSDESDEDYTVCEDELGDTEDEYCSSLAADDETDESLGEFEEDEDSEDRPIGSNSYRRRKKNGVVIPKNNKSAYDSDSDTPLSRTSSVRIPRKETRVPSTEKSRKNIVSNQEEKYGGRFDDSDDEPPLSSRFCVESPRKKTRFSSTEKSRKKTTVSNQEDKYDGSFDDSDDEPPKSSRFCVESPRKKTRVSSTEKSRKKTKVSNQEDKYDGSFDDSEDEPPLSSRFCVESPRKKTRVSSAEKSRKKTTVSYREEKYDGDFDNSDEEDSDEEFAPEELDDDDDDDDESLVTKKNKEVCFRAHVGNEKKRKMNVKSWRKNKRKKPTNGKKFDDDVRRKRKVTGKSRRKKTNTNSDPDFVSSDYEYTISEEEREQIREAGIFCRRSTASLLTYDSLKTNGEEEIVVSQRKRKERKGKEKVVDTKMIELGKQVCGICLSEEGKRSVRGILNCCSHFFCFACIMEWSKVESRCPLCKQRFATISRTARADGGRHVLKDDAVIPIPERDQVYQPSEEELRGYLYPYENVLCSECHHGGDDALMLLCDFCDSPAHTYCVGLGHEVPEGSWYCDACRPITLLTSPNSQSLNNNNNNNNNNANTNTNTNTNTNNNNANTNTNTNTNNNNSTPPDHAANNNISMSPVRETFDLNELYVPETPLTQVNGGQSPPPRYSGGDPIPVSAGAVASTLFERRRIHRTVQQFFNNRRRRSDRNAAVAGIILFGSRIVSQQAPPVQVAGPLSVHNQDYRLYGLENPRQEFIHQESTSTGFYAFDRASHGELSGIGHPQLHPCNSRSNTGAEVSLSSSSSLDKEQVQSMVRRHLKSLSRNLDLEYNNFKNIARSSTHTILAAVGLEHRRNEVYPLRTQPLSCNHLAIGQQQTHPVKGQCSSCFDLFVRNVVKEIMYA